MNWFLIIAVATAVLFTYSHAAPIAIDASILPHLYNQGQVQQDPVPDPGIGDWFSRVYDIIVKVIAKGLKDRNPKKIEALKDYIQRMRSLISPGVNFIRQYYPDDIAAHNILNAMNTYLSSLDELVKGPSVHHKDVSSQVFVQQDSPSAMDKDKEMIASYCKIMIQMLKYFKVFEEGSFGYGTEDDYCQDLELPPEPKPEEKRTILANAYQILFDLLKNNGIEDAFTRAFFKLSQIMHG
jgi:hypothetical protein